MIIAILVDCHFGNQPRTIEKRGVRPSFFVSKNPPQSAGARGNYAAWEKK